MMRLATLLILFTFSSLFSCILCPAVSAAQAPALTSEEKEQEFKRLLDEGLDDFVNKKDYGKAIRAFQAALKLKPRDPTVKKALRMARKKAKEVPPPPAPPEEVASSSQTPVISSTAVIASTQTVPGPLVPAGDKTEVLPSSGAPESPGWLRIETQSEDSKNSDEISKLISDHYNKGLLAFMDEHYSKTIKEMEAVLKIDPNHAKAKKLLMRAYSMQE